MLPAGGSRRSRRAGPYPAIPSAALMAAAMPFAAWTLFTATRCAGFSRRIVAMHLPWSLRAAR